MSESKFFCFGKNDFCTDYMSPDACLHCGKMNWKGGEMRPVPDPPRLDRSAWEPCEFCGTCENCQHATVGESETPCCYCLSTEDGIMNDFNPAGFCKYCGRPLTDAAWEMLQKRLEGRK